MTRSHLTSRALRAVLIALVGAVAVGGAGLWLSGTLTASDGSAALADRSDTTTTSTSTTSTTVATTTSTTIPPTTTTTTPPPMADGKLQTGEEGDEIAALQARLTELGYWSGSSDGRFGLLTRQAVMAFQKAEGLGRDGVAGPATQAALADATRPAPREPSGDHIEIDLARQIMFVVDDGRTVWVLNTATGNGETYAAPAGGTKVARTPPGRWRVEREIDGLRHAPLGVLYRPKYFHGGLAIHGSGNVPAQPASHGCARLTNPAMDVVWSSRVALVGNPVLIY